MAVVEPFAIIVAPAIEADVVLQPLQISAAHGLNLRIGMIPVARCGIVSLAAIAVVVGTGGLATAVACRRFRVHLISLAYPRSVGIERAVLAEVHRGE